MSIINYTTKNEELQEVKPKKQNSHLDFSERIKLEILINENYSVKEIAEIMQRPIKTIYSEISSKSIIYTKTYACQNCENKDVCENCCDKFSENLKCSPKCSSCNKLTCKNRKIKFKCNRKNKANTCNKCPNLSMCKKVIKLYSAEAAQNQYKRNRLKSKKKNILESNPTLARYIADQIKTKHYSPDVICGRLRLNKDEFKTNVTICKSTVYNNIDKGILPGVNNLDLKLKVRFRKKSGHKISTGKNNHRKGHEISTRNDEENSPKNFGHFELDLVEGVKGKELLLTFIDRFSSLLFMHKIPNKSQESVNIALNNIKNDIINKYGEDSIKSITTDNGSEFKNFEQLETLPNNKKCRVFYADPYSSWQKGKIEQANWCIRTYIYKGEDIGKYSDNEIQKIEDYLNNMPRKRLEYLTALEYLSTSKVA